MRKHFSEVEEIEKLPVKALHLLDSYASMECKMRFYQERFFHLKFLWHRESVL